MAVLSDYVSGTISLTNGSVDFTGSGTGWLLAGFKEGDTILDITGATQFTGVIASISANGAGKLTRPWEGPTLVDVPYRMRYQPDGSRVSAQARNLVELLGNGNLQALAGLSGSANMVPMFTGPGGMSLVPKTDLVSGANYDVQVPDIAARAAYDGQAEGFAVLVSNSGDGRAAIYSKTSNTSGAWSAPAYVTGPAVTLDVTDVDILPYGTPPDVTLTPVAGGYNLEFDLPAGMIVEPGTITTLAPDQPATWDWEPITGGYRVNLSIPRGPTGDINGVTPFWVTRLGSDADAAAARNGLDVPSNDEAVRYNAGQTATPAQQGQARANIGADVLGGFRNKIINGNFEIWQEGTSKASIGYLADQWMWVADGSGGVAEMSRQEFAPGQTDVPGEPRYYLRWGFPTARTGQIYNVLQQKMEGVRTLAGKRATLTFYAKSVAGSYTLGGWLIQNFGTGGTPSSDVQTGIGSHQITENWQRFDVVVDLPSISGKTLGTNGNDYLDLQLFIPANTNARLCIARVSLVEGDATAEADPYEPRHPAHELALCQRYFWRGLAGASFNQFTTAAGQNASWYIPFPVTMRTTPTLSMSGVSGYLYTPIFNLPTRDGARLLGSSSTAADGASNLAIASNGFLQADARL